MLFGTYEHCIDAKQRLTLPAKLRSKLSNPIYLTKGYDADLEIWSKDDFLLQIKEILNQQNDQKDIRNIERIIWSNTVEIDIDNLGRIKIPYNLIQNLNIEKDVFILGLGNRLEIWSKNKYNQHKNQFIKNINS
ncbi:division/cell wall cluster transcriptional repressor MraZ [Mycoplasma mycoides subsp. capri]|uniref:division/cell wall cluster transcriptional repressor MraZ n=1 Tax=Mycoplasma mycoides TaxID=2102 RepID=UPI002240B90F|nr:division/cell wall cluster transcriptional repressor MraZ [Mycoplasma mycoides]QVJ95951.1 division/cell wall cluster transcriptional repressor MraZ [Mycoplasma mycoides subsp. capri]QVJ96844.1 division/cell wall cluster transcriptional repressor MraZ [Mycoplasma mycoides subsp. capri]QVJ99885.1 division/cell wall cluster transcriptional repressor MraZ [Mycoplasma mycoides subsp. capri]QVK00707.1 division/cell wall cluster transcriptional repressor MraZ [Mycoplasma mycoides subsp. capri]